MGIDIYLRWPGMTEEDKNAQYTGYSVVHGHVGHLREAYHGGPYVTDFLVREAFSERKEYYDEYYDQMNAELSDDEECPGFEGAHIPAATLRKRLPRAIEIAKERYRRFYNDDVPDDAPHLQSFRDFVALAEEKEAIHGEGVKILASW